MFQLSYCSLCRDDKSAASYYTVSRPVVVFRYMLRRLGPFKWMPDVYLFGLGLLGKEH